MPILNYSRARQLIQEGDVLLFKGTAIYSFLIKRASVGQYSHVGIASWVGPPNTPEGLLECVEFKEWRGGRAINLDYYAENYKGSIDVYRPVPFFSDLNFDETTDEVNFKRIPFEPNKVTNKMRRMTGLPYGWLRILWIAVFKMPFIRYLIPIGILTDDTVKHIVYPVCSNVVSYCFSLFNFDLIKNRSDEWTEPSDISKSARLNYLFTLGEFDQTETPKEIVTPVIAEEPAVIVVAPVDTGEAIVTVKK
jgi:hypothetical protein